MRIAVCVLGTHAHFGEHGDTSLIERLTNGLHSVARPNALRAWFVKYGPLTYSAKTGKFTKDKSDDANPLNLDGANASPYFVDTKEASVDSLLEIEGADKMFLAAIARLEKALKDDKVAPASVQAVRNRIAAMKSFVANGYATISVVKPVEGLVETPVANEGEEVRIAANG